MEPDPGKRHSVIPMIDDDDETIAAHAQSRSGSAGPVIVDDQDKLLSSASSSESNNTEANTETTETSTIEEDHEREVENEQHETQSRHDENTTEKPDEEAGHGHESEGERSRKMSYIGPDTYYVYENEKYCGGPRRPTMITIENNNYGGGRRESDLFGDFPHLNVEKRTSDSETEDEEDEDTDYPFRHFKGVRHVCTEDCTTTLHEAAKKGKAEEIEIILATNVDPNIQDCLGRTALHYAVKGDCNCDGCIANATSCVRILIECPRTDINIQDNQGETALHLAAENQSTKCASQLLSSGADVSIKSKAGVKALKLIIEKIPEAMDSLLSRAISIEKYDARNLKCELKLDFGAIIGYDLKSNSSRKSFITKQSLDSDGNPKLRRETQLLKQVLDANSASRKKILTHPLIAIFLYLKWNRVRPLFWGTIIFHVVLLLAYTLYILDVYIISCPYRPKITEPAAVKAAKAAGIEEGFVTQGNETIRAEYIKFSFFQFSPQLNMQEIQLGITECHLEIGPTVKSVCLLILTFIVSLNEILKMLPAPKAYLKSTYNQMTFLYFLFIFITSWPVFMETPNGISFWQYQAAAFGLFLAWSMMLFQLAKLPKLGLYVEILTKVMKNFGFFMLTYASLIIAFALAFCVLFPGNAPYSSIPLSILKVLMMMVGEVNYEDLFYGEEENPVDDLLYPITGHILYGAFVIMITIVLMNLLVGLTVSDIQKGLRYNQGLQKDAESTRLTRQIEEIAQVESFIFSRRIQLIFSGKIGKWLRDRILVMPVIKVPNRTGSVKVETNCFFKLRPNDPNDKSIPEHLKLEALRVAAMRQKTSRTNQCKNFSQRRDALSSKTAAATTPMYEDGLKPPTGLHGHGAHFRPGFGTQFIGAPRPFENIRTAGQFPPPPPQYEYFLRKLEDKIMDRMKIQMDGLYQKIEEKLMDTK